MTDVLIGETGGKEMEVEKPLNILLVEDDKKLVPLIGLILKGNNVTIFDNVEQALGKLRESKGLGVTFDWVITDRGLDDGKGGVDKEGGFRVAKAIMDERLGNPFVVLFTGSAIEVRHENTDQQLKEKGIHHVLGKGSVVADFKNAIQLAREFQRQFQSPQS